jgi:cytochrome P450
MKKQNKAPFFKFLHAFRKNNHQYFSCLIAKYGESFFVKAPHRKIFFFLNPSAIKYIYFDNRQNYIKPQAYKLLHDAIGDGLILTANYDIWKKDRTIINPLFSTDLIKSYASLMAKTTEQSISHWEEHVKRNIPIRLDWEMTLITLKNLLVTFFGNNSIDFNRLNYLFRELLRLAIIHGTSLTKWQFILPTRTRFHYKKITREIHALGDQLVAECLAQPQDNIIKTIAQSYGSQVSEKDLMHHLREQALTLIAAGHETTAATLDWVFIYLSLYPLIAEKAYEEIQNILGDRLPNYEDYSALKYTRAIILETLRLQPPISLIGRKACANDNIDGYPIKKKDYIATPIYHIHRQEKYWKNPEGFDPNRFIEPTSEDLKFVYIPFGVGPRSCIGQHFAVVEATITLAIILQKYRLSLLSIDVIEPEKSIFHRPRSDIAMRVNDIHEDSETMMRT